MTPTPPVDVPAAVADGTGSAMSAVPSPGALLKKGFQQASLNCTACPAHIQEENAESFGPSWTSPKRSSEQARGSHLHAVPAAPVL